MNTRRNLLVASICAALVWMTMVAGASQARASEPRDMEIVEVDAAGHPTVRLVVTAPAALLRAGLGADAFTVIEAGERVEATVEAVSTDGLEVVLVIDTSGSMQGAPIDAARAAAAAFVRTLPAATRVAVIGFGAAPSVALPFSTDVDAQVASIGALQAGGETALFDALALAATQFTGDDAGRRAVVVLSDGGDTVSTTPLDAAVTRLEATGARVSTVELTSPENDHAALQRLTDDTGGRLVAVSDSAALDAAYRAVSADLVGRYVVEFETGRHGDTDIEVIVDAQGTFASATTTVTYPAGAPPVRRPSSNVVDGPGLLGSDPALAAGAVALFAALVCAALLALRPARPGVRLDGPRHTVGGATTRSSIGDLAQRASAAADRTLERRGRRGGVDRLLEEAGLALRAGELCVIGAVAALASAALGFLLGGPLPALVLGALGIVGVRLALTLLRDRRRRRFADQLDDLLQLLASSMRAGYGLLQAIESAAREIESPAADELRRLTTEVRLGRDLADSLDAAAARLANDDFNWVAQAIRIHREVGGDLAEVLDRVAATIRDRNRIKRQVSALSAEGRLSAYVLFVLPFALAGVMATTNPEYFSGLFSSGMGVAMTVTAGGLMTAGGLWLRHLVRPVY